MAFISFNGNLLPTGQPVLTAGNRAFRYGEGLFETIKVFRGRILLAEFHWDRLFQGMKLLRMKEAELPGRHLLEEEVLRLCEKNGCGHLARVRLQVFRAEDFKMQYLVEAVPLDPSSCQFNEGGWRIGLYPYARKSCDAFSNLKTSNHLPYLMAAEFCRERAWEDGLVLNTGNAIADSTLANVFAWKNGELLTPALHQGCINGVMRRYLLEKAKSQGIPVRQEVVTEEDLLAAEEVFLTNAIRGIRWVQSFGDKTYGNEQTESLYRKVLAPFYQ